MSEQGIEFPAQIVKVQTMQTDNGIRLTLELPETASVIMGLLAEIQRSEWDMTVSLTITDDEARERIAAKLAKVEW
jgi:hypothetical protein